METLYCCVFSRVPNLFNELRGLQEQNTGFKIIYVLYSRNYTIFDLELEISRFPDALEIIFISSLTNIKRNDLITKSFQTIKAVTI